ncbi:hypothetical protein DOY81_012695 [Sarcophaga bullata]|nr:hypothetical protein DOY81_012695 [Sarcophaga bullata]
MEKIYDSLTREQKDSDNGCRLLLDIMLHYAKSLKYGYANVYQSLPLYSIRPFHNCYRVFAIPSPDVINNLRNIFIKLIEHFPQQSLWMLLPIFKSCHNSRMKRCRLIFTDARLNNAGFQKLLNDFNMLAER